MQTDRTPDTIPRRTLGKTGIGVPVLGLGSAPGGSGLTDRKAIALFHRAIDLGVTYIDSAPGYKNAHRQLAEVLRDRRAEVVLTTKAPVDAKEDALASLEKSLGELKVDHVDIAFVHSMGGRDPNLVTSPDGALSGLQEAKKRGWTRFVGFTAHNQPAKSLLALNRAEIDVVMFAMNYADRYTYDFETRVLPAAIQSNLGIVAMKAYGGAKGMKYEKPVVSAFSGLGHDCHQQAFYYAAGLPGVATVVIGVFSVEELEQNVLWARNLRELRADEQARLDELGHSAAASLGEHFGPVLEDKE